MEPPARTVIPITPEQHAAVEAMLRQPTLAPRLRERLEMVKAASLGFDWEEIAAWSGRTPRTVRQWLTRFAIGGIAALGDAPRSGRPPTADAAYHAALDDLADRDPRALGLPFDAWTSARLSAYLAETTGVRIAPSWLRTLLIRQRFRCGRPKHTLDHLRDSAAVAACEAAIAEAEKKVASAPERYELQYQDETHVETNPYLAKQWHRIGQQQRIASVGVNRRVTVFGSKESRGRGRVEVVCGGQDSACFARYLECARSAAHGDGAGNLPRTGSRLMPHECGEYAGAGGTRGVAAPDLAGEVQPASECEGAGMAVSEAGCARASGARSADIRG